MSIKNLIPLHRKRSLLGNSPQIYQLNSSLKLIIIPMSLVERKAVICDLNLRRLTSLVMKLVLTSQQEFQDF